MVLIVQVKDAIVQFETALSLDPNPIESQAAYYNKACCHAYRYVCTTPIKLIYIYIYMEDTLMRLSSLSLSRGEGNKAADCLRVALRDYNLKFATILNDPDLASFRALPEFKLLQEEVLFLLLCFGLLIQLSLCLKTYPKCAG